MIDIIYEEGNKNDDEHTKVFKKIDIYIDGYMVMGK